MSKRKMAIVYDWIDKWGGVERVLLTLKDLYPQADFFTSYSDLKKAPWAKGLTLKHSFIQRLPGFIKNNRILSTPLYPFAFESFDFTDYGLIISVTSSFAKAVITRPETPHICYLLTPTRFLWVKKKDYIRSSPYLSLIKPYFSYLNKWDKIASQRPDHYICISNTVKARLKEIYNREGEVIYPPFDIEYWKNIKKNTNKKKGLARDKYFLVVSRLEPYKKIDLVVDTFRSLKNINLIIVGDGSQLNKLKAASKKNIKFKENLTDAELAHLYTHAQALIMPQEEDFGYASLEAQFFGCPVIAFRRGGATETVLENITGFFFNRQSRTCLAKALEKFEEVEYTLGSTTNKHGVDNTARFAKKRFIKKFVLSINKYS